MDGGLAGRILIAVGVIVVIAGVVLALGGRLPFGRLPGDLSGGGGRVSWYVPLGTSLLLSVVLTVLLNLLLRR